MDKFLVSELRKMCKKHDINTTKNGKSLRKIELMEILHNKLTKKISFSNEVEIMEHPQNCHCIAFQENKQFSILLDLWEYY